MKHSKATIGASLLLVGAMGIAGASSASADLTPQNKDVVGVGSDTAQIALDAIADGTTVSSGYNAANPARLISFDAANPTVTTTDPTTGWTVPVTKDPITIRLGLTITRPDGSGSGKAVLYGTGNQTGVNFARSSSSLSSAEVAGGLVAYPYAVDTLGVAVAKTTNAPSSLTLAQIYGIYTGSITDWSQVGGQSGAIIPEIPQSGSGTGKFFLAQLATLNGGTIPTLAPTVQTVQEQTASTLTDPNAIAPFSVGRANLGTNATLITELGGWTQPRAIYNVVRSSDAGVTGGFVSKLFASTGYLCSTAAKPLIAAGGLTQMSKPAAGGACGTKVTDTTAITNFN